MHSRLLLFTILLPLELLYGDTLPDRLEDAVFWNIVTEFSEKGELFPLQNLVSNETTFQSVIPALKAKTPPEGVYLGVGPEQNFTYIAAIKPKIAFIVDLRQENMLQQLTYKALMELSKDRSEFLSLLFSKPLLPLSTSLSAEELLSAYRQVHANLLLLTNTFKRIKRQLVNVHGFTLSKSDKEGIERILHAFYLKGADLKCNGPENKQPRNPSFGELMCQTDNEGVNHNYINDETLFKTVQQLQQANLIIPFVGNLAGPKTLKMIASYLVANEAAVTTLYLSNTEQYIKRTPSARYFRLNLANLPLTPNALVIRSLFGKAYTHDNPDCKKIRSISFLSSIQELLTGN